MTPEQIAQAIRGLTAQQTTELISLLIRQGEDPQTGVREPRKPGPESPGDAIALEQ